MALDCIADGAATVTETIFENRFMHVNELLRLGAKIEVDGQRRRRRRASSKLSGATVMATDLRASASLVIAGLVAEGETHGRPHLPPRPRLRPHGSQAARRSAPTSSGSSDVEASHVITLALSKGRIFDETLPLLAAAGIEVAEDPEKSRKLILATSRPDLRVVLVRASDVPTYVQYGGADLGVAGLDTLLEHGGAGPVPAARPAASRGAA